MARAGGSGSSLRASSVPVWANRASSKNAGHLFREFASKAASKFKAAKKKLREYRLFAKAKAEKDRMVAEVATLVEQVQKQLASTLKKAASTPRRLTKYGLAARAKVEQLRDNRTVWAWGCNLYGQLGDGTNTSAPQPCVGR